MPFYLNNFGEKTFEAVLGVKMKEMEKKIGDPLCRGGGGEQKWSATFFLETFILTSKIVISDVLIRGVSPEECECPLRVSVNVHSVQQCCCVLALVVGAVGVVGCCQVLSGAVGCCRMLSCCRAVVLSDVVMTAMTSLDIRRGSPRGFCCRADVGLMSG